MNKNKLIKTIGSKNYLEKVNKFEILMESTEVRKNLKKEMVCCHRCLESFPSDYLYFCEHKVGKRETESYSSTDPILYN